MAADSLSDLLELVSAILLNAHLSLAAMDSVPEKLHTVKASYFWF